MDSYKINGVDNLIVSHLAGSHAYGTAIATSDVDVRGVFCAEAKSIRTPWFPVKEISIPDMEDAKVYEVTNFLKLYLDCNPNILETVWVDKSDVIQSSPAYELLVENGYDLLCSRAAFTFSGYSHSQLLRIKNHGKFINKPHKKEPPKQTDFVRLVQNFTDEKTLPRDFHLDNFRKGRLVPFGDNLYGYYNFSCDAAIGYETYSDDFTLNTVFNDESRVNYKQPQLMVKFNKAEYLAEKDAWSNYWRWKKNRNETRAALEEEHGYDCKHAMHLVRLLRMGEEILTTGEVLVKRPDAKELLEIRDGAWSYEELVKYAESKDKYIREVLYPKTKLRKKPNIKLAAKILMEIQDMYWR